MSMQKIEHPNVFISYAWGSKEYQDRVVAFASSLVQDGIDVQLDKWALKEGNDKNAYMEKCVTDPSITNVLILLDKVYAEKANAHTGGVGAETQIISPEIYNKTDQSKFIPVVFEQGENGEIYKPAYLNSILHFDLSDADKYDDQYARLVKRLFGIEEFVKPQLGNRPKWIDSPQTVNIKTISAYSSLKSIQPAKVKESQYIDFLSEIKTQIVDFYDANTIQYYTGEELIQEYTRTIPIRDAYLQLLHYYPYVDNAIVHIAILFEEIYRKTKASALYECDIRRTLLHEMFIYTIAVLYKSMDYDGIAYLFGHTYLSGKYSNDDDNNYCMFYYHNPVFDEAINNRDKKEYYSGTAQFWIESINTTYCSKSSFVFADILCYNYSIFGNEYAGWRWFPISYVYGKYNDDFSLLSERLQSKEWCDKICKMFNYNDTASFKSSLIEKQPQTRNNRYRYPQAFESAPLLTDPYKDSSRIANLK